VRAADGIWAGHRDLLLQAYAAYIAQDVEPLLALITASSLDALEAVIGRPPRLWAGRASWLNEDQAAQRDLLLGSRDVVPE
jgi:hypothetical protein